MSKNIKKLLVGHLTLTRGDLRSVVYQCFSIQNNFINYHYCPTNM